METFLTVLAQQTGTRGNPLAGLLPIVLLFGVFYFLLIRPQRARMRQQQALMASVEPGDEVETIGGIYGTVAGTDDDTIFLEIAPATTIRISRGAVRRKIEAEADEAEADEAHPDES